MTPPTSLTRQRNSRQLDAVDAALTVVQAAGNTNNGSASWTYSVPDSAFDFLADGEILTLTYTATVNDGHGGIVTKPITITVTGSNDAAAITSARADRHDHRNRRRSRFVDAGYRQRHDQIHRCRSGPIRMR